MNSPTPTPFYLFFDLTHPTLLVLCTQTLLLQNDNRHISYLSCPVLTPTCLDDCPCEQWRCGVCIVLDMAILVATPDLARGIMAALDYSFTTHCAPMRATVAKWASSDYGVFQTGQFR